MRWSFKWRKELQSGLYYKLLEDGFIKPEEAEPNIQGFYFYFDAFRELNTSRPTGLDIQSIPFTAIVEYFRIYELDEFEEFLYIIRKMDDTYIEINVASRPEGKKKDGGNANKKNPNKG